MTLSGFTSGSLPVFEATLFGSNVKLIDFSWFVPHIGTIHSIARGFVYPLLIFFNLDQVYFLLRGVHLLNKGGSE